MRSTDPALQIGESGDGAVTYMVARPPSSLPPVRGRDLDAAWDAAREAASAMLWGRARRFRFRLADGSVTDLALIDRDACCWAAGVERTTGLASLYGLSLCLRLLALVDLLGRAGWARALVRLGGGAAELDPALLRAAASAELTSEARFDETRLRASLAMLPPAPAAGASSP